MAKWFVKFEVKKGNNVLKTDTTVESETELDAVNIAEAKLKKSHPNHKDYTWTLDRVTEK